MLKKLDKNKMNSLTKKISNFAEEINSELIPINKNYLENALFLSISETVAIPITSSQQLKDTDKAEIFGAITAIYTATDDYLEPKNSFKILSNLVSYPLINDLLNQYDLTDLEKTDDDLFLVLSHAREMARNIKKYAASIKNISNIIKQKRK